MGAVKKMNQQYLFKVENFVSQAGIHFVEIPLEISLFGQAAASAPLWVHNRGIRGDRIKGDKNPKNLELFKKTPNCSFATMCFPIGDAPEFLYASLSSFNPTDFKSLITIAFLHHSIEVSNEIYMMH